MMTMMMMMMVWMLRSRKMMLRRKTGPKTGEAHFERTCAIEMHWTCHNRHLVRKFTGKMPDANLGASILCEPAQSKCTWTCHNRHLVWKFTGKIWTLIPGLAFVRACAVEMHMDMSQACCAVRGKCRTLPMPAGLNTRP